MRLQLFVHFAVLGMLGAPAIVEARPIRCNGMIQFRPCETPRDTTSQLTPAKPSLVTVRRMAALQRGSSDQFARLLQQSLERGRGREGVWKGVVEGNGHVYLQLHILRKGQREAVWDIGSIKLKNKQTSFTFRAQLPSGKDWSWKIVTQVT